MGGLFGVVSKKNCRNDLFYGTDYHSHLGTKRGGMAVYNGNGIFARDIHNIENSYFRIKFEEDLPKYTGNSGIGVISDTDAQPILLNSHLGRYAVATVGKIANIEELEKEMLSRGKAFTELSSGKTNPTEMISRLISESASFEEGILNVQNSVKGSCSFLILTENGIIASRDRYGRTPLILAEKITEEGTDYAIASETCSLLNLGYEQCYILGPGEAVHVTSEGYRTCVPARKEMQICSFMWVYYGYPASSYENINVDQVRYHLGYSLGCQDKSDIDVAASIPDSGTCMAIGFAQGKGIPFRNAIVKYTPTWPRSFTPQDQSVRKLIAKMKLIPNISLLREKSIVFCDDSIVRGTQLKDNVNHLYEYGAKDIHIRISCPPLLHPCPFLNFSSSKGPLELIARRFIESQEGAHDRKLDLYSTPGTPEYQSLVEHIREELKVATLEFNTVEHIVEAIGLPKCSICTHCFDGSSYGHE